MKKIEATLHASPHMHMQDHGVTRTLRHAAQTVTDILHPNDSERLRQSQERMRAVVQNLIHSRQIPAVDVYGGSYLHDSERGNIEKLLNDLRLHEKGWKKKALTFVDDMSWYFIALIAHSSAMKDEPTDTPTLKETNDIVNDLQDKTKPLFIPEHAKHAMTNRRIITLPGIISRARFYASAAENLLLHSQASVLLTDRPVSQTIMSFGSREPNSDNPAVQQFLDIQNANFYSLAEKPIRVPVPTRNAIMLQIINADRYLTGVHNASNIRQILAQYSTDILQHPGVQLQITSDVFTMRNNRTINLIVEGLAEGERIRIYTERLGYDGIVEYGEKISDARQIEYTVKSIEKKFL